jgi:hypothetical protein
MLEAGARGFAVEIERPKLKERGRKYLDLA